MYISGFLGYYATFCYEKSTANPNAGFSLSSFQLDRRRSRRRILRLPLFAPLRQLQMQPERRGLLADRRLRGLLQIHLLRRGITTTSKADFSGIVYNTPIPGLSAIPYIGPILFGYGFSVYLAILLAILSLPLSQEDPERPQSPLGRRIPGGRRCGRHQCHPLQIRGDHRRLRPLRDRRGHVCPRLWRRAMVDQ
jgi:hypothetical protein